MGVNIFYEFIYAPFCHLLLPWFELFWKWNWITKSFARHIPCTILFFFQRLKFILKLRLEVPEEVAACVTYLSSQLGFKERGGDWVSLSVADQPRHRHRQRLFLVSGIRWCRSARDVRAVDLLQEVGGDVDVGLGHLHVQYICKSDQMSRQSTLFKYLSAW